MGPLPISRELDGHVHYEIIVVDGNSSDGTLEFLASAQNVYIITEDKPRGCCFAYDLGFRSARGEWVCWLNDDIEVYPGSFSKMISFMMKPENSRVGMGIFTASKNRSEPMNFVLQTCMSLPIPYACFGMLKRDLLKQLGYLDLNYQKYGWDPDLALKIWDAGYTVEPCPGAHIIHYFAEDDLRRRDEGFRAIDCNYLAAKWRDKTRSISSRVDLKNPNYLNAWNELSPYLQTKVLLYTGEVEQAEKIALSEFKHDPKAIEYFYLMGVTLAQEGETELASRVYLKVISHAEKDKNTAAWAHFKYGEYLEERGHIKQSRIHWNKAIQLNSDHSKSYIKLLDICDPFRVIISQKKITKSGYIWIHMNILDEKMWDYYFSLRKIDHIELHYSLKLMINAIDVVPHMLQIYLKYGASFMIFFPKSEAHHEIALESISRKFSQHGLEIEEYSSCSITGKNPPLI